MFLSPKTGIQKVNLKQYVNRKAQHSHMSTDLGGEINMLQKVTPRGPKHPGGKRFGKKIQEANIDKIFSEINENKGFKPG